MKDANTIIDESVSQREEVYSHVRAAADFFHEHEGTFFERGEAIAHLSDELSVEADLAGNVIAELVGDIVDPVVLSAINGKKYVGVVEFEEFDGAYGYVDYHDVRGPDKRVVCQQCVNEAKFDTQVAHATAGDPSGTVSSGADYDELLDIVHEHYTDSHEEVPEDVATGATLASGTTIGGNISFHAGNDGIGSGLTADTVGGIALSSDESVSLTYNESAKQISFTGAGRDAGDVITQFSTPGFSPQGVGLDSSDSIWHADTTDLSIYQLNQNGTILSQFASPSFDTRGLGVASNDSIWNATDLTNYIVEFDRSGTVQGSSSDVFAGGGDATGVGLDSNDSIWNASDSDESIYQLNQSGDTLSRFASPSSSPYGIGFDSNDSIWHADKNADSIYQLNQSGSVLSQFASPSGAPVGLGVDSSDRLWNANAFARSIYQIQAQDSEADFLTLNQDELKLDDNKELQLSSNGEVSIRYDSDTDNIRVAGDTVTFAGEVLSQFASPSTSPIGIGLDSNDSIWNADSSAISIYQLNQSGGVLSQFASPSSTPRGIGLDSSDSIWNADSNADSIYQLNQSGSVLSQFASPSASPTGLGVDSSDSLWHADANADSIYQLNQSGSVLSQFASPDGGPVGISLDSSDSLWNADSSAEDIYQLNQSGSVLSQFASPCSGPTGLGVDSSDSLWHADANTRSIYQLAKLNNGRDMLALERETGNLTIDGTLTEGTLL